MINDTEKKKTNTTRSVGILLGACAFALALGAIAQITAQQDSPLHKAQQDTTKRIETIEELPQSVTLTTQQAGMTPAEYASMADAIYEQASREAATLFDEQASDTEDLLAVDGVPQTEKTDAQPSEPTVYILPAGTQIVKDYSMGVPVFSNTMQDWRTHNGIDFACAEGDPVFAAADATVAAVYEDVSWGGVAVLDFGNGMTAEYCGLQPDSISLQVGDKIASGEVVGVVGTVPIEADEGCHLHYEMRNNGVLVDPLEAMGRGGTDG